jgi:hypothetical protein
MEMGLVSKDEIDELCGAKFDRSDIAKSGFLVEQTA